MQPWLCEHCCDDPENVAVAHAKFRATVARQAQAPQSGLGDGSTPGSELVVAISFLKIAKWVVVPFAFMALSWAVMIVLAKRLPPGSAKDLASFLPACATTLRKLRGHPDVPPSAKAAIVFALLWVLSPIDLIPEFIPVIGPLDDVVVVALCLRFAAKRVPRPLLLDAWPAEPRIIEKLIGPAPTV